MTFFVSFEKFCFSLPDINIINEIDYVCVHAELLQLCLALYNLMDSSPPGSSVPGILQARILEWAAMPSSLGSYQLRDRTSLSYVSYIDKQVL